MKAIWLLLTVLWASTLSVNAQVYFAEHVNKGRTEPISDKGSAKKETEESTHKWEFISGIPPTFNEQTIQQADAHKFGQRVACLKVLMDKYYVSKEEIVPGDPTMRTIIKKPGIYNATRKIEKFLKKEVDKGKMDISNATATYAHVLEVAITVVEEQNITLFESALEQSKKDVQSQLGIFRQVKLTGIY